MKSLFIDTETTGTDPQKHCVHQIAGKLFFGKELIECFNYQFLPHPAAEVDPAIFTLNPHLTPQTLAARDMSFFTAYGEFKKILAHHIDAYNRRDKAFLFAYNARFDYDFLRSMFERIGDHFFGSFIWFPPIDIMNLAALRLLKNRPSMENFKLRTVAAFLDIPVEAGKLHDALYDIELSMQIMSTISTFEFQQ